MEEDLNSIIDNKMWELATLPGDHHSVGLKWVFKLKKDLAGEIVKHKARQVTKGYAQRQGVNFEEVFAPMERIDTVRLLLTLVVAQQVASESHGRENGAPK